MKPVRELPQGIRLTCEADETQPGQWQGRFSVYLNQNTESQRLLQDGTLPDTFGAELEAKTAALHAGIDWIYATYPLPE